MTTPPEYRSRRGLAWWAGLFVATGAIFATAHGLYEVAVAARVWRPIAWLYPLITDGLALVAYAATARLRTGVGYAWAVVVLAAGLSGLAQAVYLSGDGFGAAPPALRFGIGAWPALSVTIVGHLLYLLGRVEGGTPAVSHARGVPERLSDVPERVTGGPSPVVERPRVTVPAEPRHAAKADEKTAADVLNADDAAGIRLGVRKIRTELGVSDGRARDLRKEADELAALMASSVPIHHANGSN